MYGTIIRGMFVIAAVHLAAGQAFAQEGLPSPLAGEAPQITPDAPAEPAADQATDADTIRVPAAAAQETEAPGAAPTAEPVEAAAQPLDPPTTADLEAGTEPQTQDQPINVIQQDKPPAAPAAAPPLDATAVSDIVRQTVAELEQRPRGSAPPYRWEAGFELTFLRPYFDDFSNGAVFGSTFGTIEAFTNQEPQYDMEPSPRVWIGYVAPNGAGIRARYWQFDHESNTVSAADFEGDPPVLIALETLTTSLEMHVLDVELTYQREFPVWTLIGSVGVRYAHLERDGIFERVFPDDDFMEKEFFESDFEGYGATVALEGRRRIAGGLSGFVNTRGSILAGNRKTAVYRFDIPSGQPPTLDVYENRRTDDSLVVGELQIGAEWATTTGPWQWFVRTALEVQYWRDGGHVLEGGGEDSPHDDLTLLGVLIGGGFRR
jgi:hypothetical protein